MRCFRDKHSELNGKIRALKEQNEAYIKEQDLVSTKTQAENNLKNAINKILEEIQKSTNDKMKELNDILFVKPKKPPVLIIKNHKSYEFKTPNDTGTGTNYKGMLLYDLANLILTNLPAIAHDSLLFKNIGKHLIIRVFRFSRR